VTSASTAMLMARMGLSLAIVLGLIWGASRVLRRRGRTLGRSATDVEVVARRSTGRRSNLLVVRIGGRTLLVGATDNQVSLVADVTEPVGTGETAPDELKVPNPVPITAVPITAVPAARRVDQIVVTTDPETGAVTAGPSPSVDLRQPSRPTEALGARSAQLLDSIRDLTVRRA
jgi:flagellar protein FliO/FliZ